MTALIALIRATPPHAATDHRAVFARFAATCAGRLVRRRTGAGRGGV